MSATVSDLLKEKKGAYSAAELAALAARFRVEMFDVLHERQTGHWGGASSAAEIVTALYFSRLKIDPSQPKWEGRDRFVLSKGHASVNLYTVLARRGFFAPAVLPSFRTLGSILQGHPSMKLVPGVDFSTGALGHGLSVACGMALSAALSGAGFRTYVLTGEGCLDEGSTWEAMLFAAKYRPKGLVFLVDYNKVQLDGRSEDILPLEPLADKFTAFGWHLAPRAYDGHCTADILRSFAWLDGDDVWPKAVIYDTVKGKGVDFMEGKNAWHGAAIDDGSYAKGRPQLLKDAEAKEAAL
ncbi:transketolase [Treponema endosymbiont of Eucomonympha sp.]|uniref:transketolase n=1 Tax=Treponema endosymbiont of Eucomonympha sp. TaxID=1580831 RepID=UPI000750E315|nr:transketolase [Treponema endosymbiont of Eucomonympha sp.]